MSWIRRIAIAGAILLIAVATILFAARDPRVHLGTRELFTKRTYLAFAQPWGGAADPVFKHWAAAASTILIDPARFPDNTGLSWRWPPKAPSAGGPWGYDFVAYGNYDDGAPERAVTPRRVRDIQVLTQSFDWTANVQVGAANMLTELYLRRDPADPESKQLEIGWFLQTPPATASYGDGGRQIGTFRASDGTAWQVALNERYCTFMPVDRREIHAGSLDMLAAIRWLQEHKLVTGDEWFTGVAIGIEPLKGVGSAQINRWSVSYR